MPTHFKDHFSKQAAVYQQFRPTYPDALFAYLAEVTPNRKHAWDCATGNGQAARGLAPYFEQITATDASAAQVALAHGPPNIHFGVAPAEASDLPAGSVSLIMVSQALHWFDFEAFYTEAQRVLQPEGILTAWTYPLLQITPDLDRIVWQFAEETIGPYWPPERRHVDAHYRTIPFPFEEISPPDFTFSLAWTLDQLIGYLNTWSATQRYKNQHQKNPVAGIHDVLKSAWGDVEKRTVTWPLILRIGRHRAT